MGLIVHELAVDRGGFTLEVSFQSDARWLAVFGRSGAGKTTLLDVVAGLRSPRRGRIEAGGTVYVDAAEGRDLPPRRRRVGYVRQAPDLFPKMTVEENLRFAQRRAPERAEARREEIVELLGLRSLRHRRPADLSGGESRRAQIGRAVASAPSLLLLDEPLAGMDETSRREILSVFALLKERFSMPAILVSHRYDEVLAFADEVVVLEEGRLLARGEPFETLSRPAVWPVARLSGVENVLSATVRQAQDGEGGTLVEWEGSLWHVPRQNAAAGSAVTLGLFAEDVLLAREFSGRISARNCLAAEVERVSESPGEALVALRVGSGRVVARITRGALRELEITPGASVRLLVKSTALRTLA